MNRTHFYLGNILWKQQHLNLALDEFTKCFMIRVAKMPDHHYTALTMHKIGVLLVELGDLDSCV
jgi:hypothetical protein